MSQLLRLLKIAFCCLLMTVYWGCSTTSDYKKSTATQPLEVPPDLIGSTQFDEQMAVPDGNEVTNFSDYHGQTIQQPLSKKKENILPQSERVQIKHDGNTRWLMLQGEPEMFWSKIKQFWLENGFTLKVDNPTIGIMETEWAEKRADIPQGGIRKYLAKALSVLYSSPTRNKFRVRLERGNVADMTELYLTHRGAQEVARGRSFIWENRPSNSELEAEMLKRLMIFIGIDKKQADTLLAEKPVSRAQLMRSKEDQVYLVVNDDFAQTWRSTGLALDRLGFTVEDRDRSGGLYFIRYIDPKAEQGFFSSLFGNKSNSDNQAYRINLLDDSATTRIVVLNNEGKISPNKTAERILTLLHEELK